MRKSESIGDILVLDQFGCDKWIGGDPLIRLWHNVDWWCYWLLDSSSKIKKFHSQEIDWHDKVDSFDHLPMRVVLARFFLIGIKNQSGRWCQGSKNQEHWWFSKFSVQSNEHCFSASSSYVCQLPVFPTPRLIHCIFASAALILFRTSRSVSGNYIKRVWQCCLFEQSPSDNLWLCNIMVFSITVGHRRGPGQDCKLVMKQNKD